MSTTDIIAQQYREAVAEIVTTTGESANRREAAEQAASALAAQYRRGEVAIDPYAHFLDRITKVDERDGAAADRIIDAALATGEAHLFDADLDVIVTLGKGKRKPWGYVTAVDLREMNDIRFANVKSVQRAYHRDWLPKYSVLLDTLMQYKNFGDAHHSGGFPPADLLNGKAAA